MAATGPRLVSPEHVDSAGSPPLLQPRSGNTEIDYSDELIERIRAETVDAFLRIPHGGLEIAGVLFGTKLGHTLHLTASRPIDCEHARGPSLTLSSRDEQGLDKLLTEARRDPTLDGLEPLGWYVSHTRRPFTVAESDSDVFDRFFTQPMQVTAVVRPEAAGVAQFHVFARHEDGSIDPERPTLEFTAHPTPTRLKPELPSVSAANRPPEESVDLVPVKLAGEHWVVPYERPAALQPQVRQIRVSNFSLIMAAVLLVLLVAGGAVWWVQFQPEAVRPVPLHVTESGQQLRIDWDPAAAVVQQARSGALEIGDLGGSPVRINLGPEILRTGSVLYSKPSDKVEIRLQLVDDKQHVSESMVYFLAREQPAPKVESVTTVADAAVSATPPEKVSRETPEKPAPRVDKKSAPSEAKSVRNVPLRAFTKPPVPTRAVSAVEPAVIEAPKIPITQAQPAAPLVGSLHTELSPPPPVVVEKAKTDAPKQRPTPVSGRLIWTGDLHKGTVLKLTNRGASTGALNGTLPGVPVKVNVRAGELLDGAIAIYSSDPNARQSAEAPSRHNGWNVTLYKWDPKRAHDVVVVEAPAQANDWKQLVLKSLNRTTIIVIDWQQTGN
jgi:hypothetical protein